MTKLGSIWVECFRQGTKGTIPYRIFDAYEKTEPTDPHYRFFEHWLRTQLAEQNPLIISEMEAIANKVVPGNDVVICYAYNLRHQAYYCDIVKKVINEVLSYYQ